MTATMKTLRDTKTTINRRVTWDSVMPEPEEVQSAVRWRVSSHTRVYRPTESDPNIQKEVRPQLSAALSFNDCNRLVTMDFYGPNGLDKLDNIIRTLGDMRRAYADHDTANRTNAALMAAEGYKYNEDIYMGAEDEWGF